MDSGRPPAGTSASASPKMRVKKLEKDSELRIEVGEAPVTLRLLDGTAEIFGTKLPQARSLTFPPRRKFAVFTWHGATIGLHGATESEYTANETPMVSYVNVNQMLTSRRNHAKESVSEDYNTSQGPRVIVVGPKDSGRSTLSRMLVSWATKLGWNPTLVDLNVSKGSITIPGCIAAMEIKVPIDPVEGVPRAEYFPLYYFFGHTNLGHNVELYKFLVKELAQMLDRRFSFDAESRTSGMVINTMGWKESLGTELLLHVIETFKANVVLVLGHDKLFNILSNGLRKRPNVDVVKLQKSGGVVSRSKAAREKAISDRMRQYFYRVKKDFCPHYSVAKFSDLCVYRIADGPQATTSALQIGAQPVASSPLKLVAVDFGQQLVNQVLAISFTMETDKIISCNVAGFICILGIDMDKKKIAYLSPSPEELASKNLILGSLSWVDEEN